MEILNADGTKETRLTFSEVHLDGDMMGVSFKVYPESPDVTPKFWISARDLVLFCKEKYPDTKAENVIEIIK